MMWTKPSSSLVVVLLCLMTVGEIRAQCERPSIGANRVLAEDTSLNIFSEGTTLTYKCFSGYVPVKSASSRTITCKDKQWTDLELECTEKSCGSLGEILNGRYLTPDGIAFGATAIVQCDDGYMVSGPSTRNCRSDGWDGRPAECEVMKCKPPSSILHGAYEPVKEVFDYNEVVIYSCDQDYTLSGESVVSCSDNGKFPPPPLCLFVQCETPNIENANRVEGKRPPYGYKNVVRYECIEGYTLAGSGSLVCEVNGWNPPPPTCISNRIDPIPDPPSPTEDPETKKKRQTIAIGIGVGLGVFGLLIIGVATYFWRKKVHWGKVPTRNEGST